jgi:glutamate N-acetyltransferase / amino-acid N-acetyltransferase
MSSSPAVTSKVLSFARLLRGQIRAYSAPLDSSIPESKQKYVPTSGTYPKGFKVSGTHVGVKASNTKFPDLAFIASEKPCSGAAVFTTNKFQAAPVKISRAMLEARHGQGVRGIIINSGCANAVTGKGGEEDALAMGETASSCFPDDPDDGLGHRSIVMSTGVIGQRLPIKRILDKIPQAFSSLDSSHSAWSATARSICTTDTFPKLLSTTFTLPSSTHKDTIYSLAGMTKGAGMIHPNMATLLAILCTDAPISAPALSSLLKTATSKSFNCISIDGDTSTNDTLAILANGCAAPEGTPPIANDQKDSDYIAMSRVLADFSQRLAQLVVRDGEGATKFVEVHVHHAPSTADAKAIASTIARSPLVKTALYGKDANWGRILCAIGYTPALSPGAVVPEKTNVSFVPVENSASKGEGVLKLLVNGEPETVDEERAARLLQDEDLKINVNLGTGKEEAKYWFCDFSHEYVTINGDYRT